MLVTQAKSMGVEIDSNFIPVLCLVLKTPEVMPFVRVYVQNHSFLLQIRNETEQ